MQQGSIVLLTQVGCVLGCIFCCKEEEVNAFSGTRSPGHGHWL